MKNYDCIIIGDDIYALIVALFLARKMRNVLLINQPSPYKLKTENVTVNFKKESYDFQYNIDAILTGLDEGGLTEAFLDDLDLLNDLDYQSISEDYIVDKEGNQKRRNNQFKEFKIYLMRYYPKNIKEIRRFFGDLDRHYNNYKQQYLNLLHNDDYTLSSLMVEWGSYSLDELLKVYFDDNNLVKEFISNPFINGLNIKKVSAYNFFANYFIGLKCGFYYIKNQNESLRKIILEKIKTSSKNVIINTKITNIISNDHKIDYIEDDEGNQYGGKYYFVSDQPIEFYNDYFPNLETHVKKLKDYYPNIEDTIVKRTMYIVLEQKPHELGINHLLYYYQDNQNDHEKMIKIFNYSKIEEKPDDVGKICVDFTYDKKDGFNEDNLMDKLYQAFPKLKWLDMEIEYGKELPYLAMLRKENLRRKPSISNLIDYESFNHINVYDNLYVGGAFIRPESSLYGKFQQAIVSADKIEDGLYFKDEDEEYYYSNEEVMMMLRQNFDPSYFGRREIHINFYIGKSSYFFRIKGKHIIVHRGRYGNPDLTIITSNDRLTDLIFKKTPYVQIIQSDFFKYIGKKETMQAFIKAFDLDDRHPLNKDKIEKAPFKRFGLIYVNIYMFMIALSAFLIHFVQGLFIYWPLFLVILGLVVYKKIKVKTVNTIEILLLLVFMILAVLSIFIDDINHYYRDQIVLVPALVLLFVSVIINRPFVKNYVKYDYSTDFVHTNLFQSITNGLTFLWVIIYLVIVIGPFFTGERYVSVWYNLIFVGMFLSYFYPSIYINTSIKQS
ncbi:MAG TPA: hypothetical protein VJ878_01770 [Candidatus Izemoplasmatales bacterium]|nr:hypothetical protein [Candidatus Izemoplasmatales bacterium]